MPTTTNGLKPVLKNIRINMLMHSIRFQIINSHEERYEAKNSGLFQDAAC